MDLEKPLHQLLQTVICAGAQNATTGRWVLTVSSLPLFLNNITCWLCFLTGILAELREVLDTLRCSWGSAQSRVRSQLPRNIPCQPLRGLGPPTPTSSLGHTFPPHTPSKGDTGEPVPQAGLGRTFTHCS